MAHDVFISYAGSDSAFANHVCAQLEDAGIQCWIAPRDIKPGVLFDAAIADAARSCALYLVIVSRHSASCQKVLREVEFAFANGQAILPIRIDNSELDPAMQYFLATLQWIDASKYPPEDHLQGLPDRVRILIETAKGAVQPSNSFVRSNSSAVGESRNSETNAYDVFISYRRELDDMTARYFFDRMKERGISAFLDVVSLSSGRFDQRLFREIEAAPNFLLLLSPGALDRCINDGDWLRDEIGHALITRRNVVPLLRNGFDFPGTLPDVLAPLRTINGVPYSHDYVDATIDRLLSFFVEVRG